MPNTGGFDALKSSGTLSRLQGRDIENLLFRYYDAVDRVQRLERDLQIAQTTYASRESPKLPESVEYYALVDPLALPPNRFEELQPFYRSFLQGTAFAQDMQVVELLTNSIAPIVHEYDKLLELGQYFVTMIEKDALRLQS